MISKELRQVIEDWYVLKTYGEVYENLHRDNQADIDHHFDVTGNYGQVLSDNDWAALCKEWAFYTHKFDFEIIRIKRKKDYGKVFVRIHTIHTNECNGKEFYPFDIEPEAIFKACQWILDHMKGA